MFERLADDPARRLAHRLAFHFPIEHGPAHELAREARCVANLHPAGRFGADREVPDVLLVFDLARPDELAVVRAPLDVELKPYRLGQTDALQTVHLGTYDEHVLE